MRITLVFVALPLPTGGLFYADILLPLRGALARAVSQEGAHCNIIQVRCGQGLRGVLLPARLQLRSRPARHAAPARLPRWGLGSRSMAGCWGSKPRLLGFGADEELCATLWPGV